MHPHRGLIWQLRKLIRGDTRYTLLRRKLSSRYPAYLPMSRNVLADGVPILMLLDLCEEAHKLGLGALPEPGILLLTFLLDEDNVDEIELTSREKEAAFWFYQRFSRNESIVQIADRDGYSDSTVRQTITRATKLLGVRRGCGRPKKSEYAAPTL